jgi:hypothetical protein
LRLIETDENGQENLGRRPGSAICDVKSRKSKCSTQLEGLRLLASGDFDGYFEGIFGGANIGRLTVQQKLTTDALLFCNDRYDRCGAAVLKTPVHGPVTLQYSP